jgi:glycosyltransferase involved in cell wall biosynthesis
VAKVLFVISSLDYSGPARALVHLVAGLPRDHFALRVLVLGRESPWCEEVRGAGVAIDVLGWHRPIHFLGAATPFSWLNRKIAGEAPVVIHAWGLAAAWALVAGGWRPGRLRLSAALPSTRAGLPTRWLLRRAGAVLALGDAEAEEYRRLGVAPQRLTTVAAGVPVLDTLPAPATLPVLPDDARVILCPGPVERHRGHRDAAWAMDILRLACPGTHLVIVGHGPGLDAVRRLMASNRLHDCVHLAGPVADVQPWLARAEAVWVSSLRRGGRFACLEAMAASLPVVASRLPGLAELIVEGQTGYLVGRGDKVELARKTRLLLDQPDLAREMGAAGRCRVRDHFGLEAFREGVARWLERG